MSSPKPIRVAIETTDRKTFASALDWPGWSRSGRTEEAALEALAAHRERYRTVVEQAGAAPLPDAPFAVIERKPGDAGTAFGVPAIIFAADQEPVSRTDGARLAALVEAAWQALAAAAHVAPSALRKGPRGGGRDRDAVVEHVESAHPAYARSLGATLPASTVEAVRRAAMLDVLRAPSDGSPPEGARWPQRYAARRVAWHALDHAWEIEDRSSA